MIIRVLLWILRWLSWPWPARNQKRETSPPENCQEIVRLRALNAELLEALKLARPFVSDEWQQVGDERDLRDLEKIDAAIAKAEPTK